MRRFPLRLKIAGFAAGLILLATVLVALFTVILPWRAKLKAQERLAPPLVETALPPRLGFRAGGGHFDPAPRAPPGADSHRGPGAGSVYPPVWGHKGKLASAP